MSEAPAERGASGRGGAGRSGGGHTNGNLQRLWKQVVDQLVAQAPAKGSLLLSSTAVSDDGEKLMVSLPKGSHFASRMLERSDVRASVDPVVAAAFGPRQVVYVESSLAGADIARADRAPAPSPQPAPASKPAPAPEPQPQPAAPAEPEKPAYPMPWDEPAARVAPAPEPVPDDVVPYTDADITVYEEVFEPDLPVPMPADAGATDVPSGPDAGVLPSASHEVSEERGDERRAAGQDAGVGSGGGGPELTPEFASIASMLAEAFGQPLSVSVESAVTTSDEDAAGELSYDEGPEPDEGFTDEPVDDEDDD